MQHPKTDDLRTDYTEKLLFQVAATIALTCHLAFAADAAGPIAEGMPNRVIAGQVFDANSKPVRGAWVEWGHFAADRQDRETTRTDEDGRFQLVTQSIGIDFRLGAHAIGHGPVWIDNVIPPLESELANPTEPPPSFALQLTKAHTAKGIVLNDKGNPLAGVTIAARSPSHGVWSSFSNPIPSFPFPGPDRRTVTDSQGRFRLRYLPPTRKDRDRPEDGFQYDVFLDHNGGVRKIGSAFSEADNTLTTSRLWPDESTSIQVTVRDAETFEPIPNFKFTRRYRPDMTEVNSAQGRANLAGVPLGRRTQYYFYADNYRAQATRIQPAAHGTKIEIQLTKQPSIHGIIVDANNSPISGARVVIGQSLKPSRFRWGSFDTMIDGHGGFSFVQRTASNDDGEFMFSDSADGRIIAILAKGYQRQLIHSPTIRDYIQSKTSNPETPPLKVALRPESQITGTVAISGFTPAELRVQLTNRKDWMIEYGNTTVDRDGEFAISNLQGGEYQISVYTNRSGGPLLSLPITLDEDTTKHVNLNRLGGNLTLSGTTSPFAYVQAQRQLDENHHHTAATFADAEGKFKITGLHAGDHSVSSQVFSALRSFRATPQPKNVVLNEDTELDLEINSSFEFETKRVTIPKF